MSSGMSLEDVVNGAVGNMPGNCMGYMNPGASGSGYIATMKLSVDKIDMTGLDPGAGGIVSYDRCEKDDAYIGQINMGTASSFCGVNGALWGLHLAVADDIQNGTLEPMWTYPGPHYPPGEKLPAQGPVPVYPVAPLLDAAERLFGRMDPADGGENDLRRYPPLPGAHVICANKDASGMGGENGSYFWSAIGIAIAHDRETQANLFIEDCGQDRVSRSPEEAKAALQSHLRAVSKSMVLCGQDQDVTYVEIFIGGKFIWTGPNEWGCSLACAPYVVLAEDAVSGVGQPADLCELSIDQWEKSVGLGTLPPAPFRPDVGGIGVVPGEA
ncbi:histidine decarboxylase [Nocardioides sp.]|nr:histidine decarboxylase [Nocardioides sp.]